MAIPKLNEVTRIDILANWFGLGPPRHEGYQIVRRRGAFFGGPRAARPIDSQAINALLRSLEESPLNSPDPTNMGFSPEWLEANLEQAIEDRFGDYSRDGKRRLRDLLDDFDYFSDRMCQQFTNVFWTDDAPVVQVLVYSHTCAPVDASSSSQQPFMIPWEVTTPDGNMTTHNARIGCAVAGLLPEDFLERPRLNGGDVVQGTDAIRRVLNRFSSDEVLLDQAATTLHEHTRRVSTLLPTRDQKYLISGGLDDKVNVWDTRTWAKQFEFDTPREGVLLTVALGADDVTIAFNDASLIKLVNLETGQITRKLDGHTWVVVGLVFSHDGKQLVSEDSDKIIVWDVGESGQQACFSGEHLIGFSFDDAKLFTTARQTLFARDTKTFESTVIADECKLACVSPKGTKLAWVNSKSILHVWDLECNRELYQAALLSPAKNLAFADTDEFLGCIMAEGALLVLDLVEQRIRLMSHDEQSKIQHFTFSPDGRHISARQDKYSAQRITVCEVTSRRNVLQVHTTSCDCLAMLPDGKTIVTGHSDGSIKVWHVRP